MSGQPGAALEVRGDLHGWYAVVQVSGEFRGDCRLAARLHQVMVGLPMPDPPCLVLDLAGVVAWDDWGVGAVIASAKRVMSVGGAMVVAAAPADLLAHCERMGLDRPFRFSETVEAAVEELRSGR
ncbi:STAS domain-containing protein [Nonomuraea sp. MCN248]|uniref:STAS domain-containing protein n=1 Tax=Nonomuraea corallina TaxID=2989783 RepID=A0ABT4S6K9_9ACTN|nr:STAS domain-containing protein [Nonomuraea corallina]MDA0632688.1 STAS domain-containing protein [Nonomuraea corallina]